MKPIILFNDYARLKWVLLIFLTPFAISLITGVTARLWNYTENLFLHALLYIFFLHFFCIFQTGPHIVLVSLGLTVRIRPCLWLISFLCFQSSGITDMHSYKWSLHVFEMQNYLASQAALSFWWCFFLSLPRAEIIGMIHQAQLARLRFVKFNTYLNFIAIIKNVAPDILFRLLLL